MREAVTKRKTPRVARADKELLKHSTALVFEADKVLSLMADGEALSLPTLLEAGSAVGAVAEMVNKVWPRIDAVIKAKIAEKNEGPKRLVIPAGATEMLS